MLLKSSILAIAALIFATLAFDFSVSATEAVKTTVLAQGNSSEMQKQTGAKKTTGPIAVKPIRGVSKLATHDCRLNGTVVEISDDRCGSSHQYCKINGVAQCIDFKD